MWRALLLASLAGCFPWPPESDDCSGSAPFKAGVYRSKGGSAMGSGWPFPQAAAGAKTMVIERQPDDSAIVRISYQRAGKTIVETWAGKLVRPEFGQSMWEGPPPPHFALRLFPPNPMVPPLSVQLGSSGSVEVGLWNVGNQPLPAPTTVVEGEGFRVQGTTCGELPPANHCKISLEFRPTSAGSVLGRLTITAAPAAPVSFTQPAYGYVLDAGPDAARDVDGNRGDADPPDAGPRPCAPGFSPCGLR